MLLTFLFSLSTTTNVSSQTKVEQKKAFQATYNQSKSIVQSEEYRFVAELVYENKTRERIDSDSNSLIIENAYVKGSLSSLSAQNKTFSFNATIENYKVSFDDNMQQISIQFVAKSSTQSTEITIDVKRNGNAFLVIKNAGKPVAYYTGKLKTI